MKNCWNCKFQWKCGLYWLLKEKYCDSWEVLI